VSTRKKHISFPSLKRHLKQHEIYWEKRKGKGGHGAFVGPDQNKNKQAFSLPTSQHRQVQREYVSSLCRRFGLDINELM